MVDETQVVASRLGFDNPGVRVVPAHIGVQNQSGVICNSPFRRKHSGPAGIRRKHVSNDGQPGAVDLQVLGLGCPVDGAEL